MFGTSGKSGLALSGQERDPTAPSHRGWSSEELKFLIAHLTNYLTRTSNTSGLVKNAQQRPFFSEEAETSSAPPEASADLLQEHHPRKLHNRVVVRTAQCIVGMLLPHLDEIYTNRLRKKATDSTHPGHQLLPSGKRFRTIKSCTNRLRNGFFPRAVASITPATPPTAPSMTINQTDRHTCILHCLLHISV